jgi:hypothetical protein
MTTYQLHKTPEGYIVTSNEDIQIGEKYIDDTNYIRRSITGEGEYWRVRNNYRKVIEKLIDLSTLSQPEQDKICWFDVEGLAEEYRLNTGWEDSANLPYTSGFIRGFQKAQDLLYPLLKQTSWNVEVEITESIVKVTKILE